MLISSKKFPNNIDLSRDLGKFIGPFEFIITVSSHLDYLNAGKIKNLCAKNLDLP